MDTFFKILSQTVFGLSVWQLGLGALLLVAAVRFLTSIHWGGGGEDDEPEAPPAHAPKPAAAATQQHQVLLHTGHIQWLASHWLFFFMAIPAACLTCMLLGWMAQFAIPDSRGPATVFLADGSQIQVRSAADYNWWDGLKRSSPCLLDRRSGGTGRPCTPTTRPPTRTPTPNAGQKAGTTVAEAQALSIEATARAKAVALRFGPSRTPRPSTTPSATPQPTRTPPPTLTPIPTASPVPPTDTPQQATDKVDAAEFSTRVQTWIEKLMAIAQVAVVGIVFLLGVFFIWKSRKHTAGLTDEVGWLMASVGIFFGIKILARRAGEPVLDDAALPIAVVVFIGYLWVADVQPWLKRAWEVLINPPTGPKAGP